MTKIFVQIGGRSNSDILKSYILKLKVFENKSSRMLGRDSEPTQNFFTIMTKEPVSKTESANDYNASKSQQRDHIHRYCYPILQDLADAETQ